MKKRIYMIPSVLLLIWFFLDMTGVYFGNQCLVTQTYKDDGVFFIIYALTLALFVFKEKTGKWVTLIWLLIWFIMQFINHEWYTIFGSGFMGTTSGKIRYFADTIKWLSIEGRYVPDLYHTVLHILIIISIISMLIYISKSKSE